VTVTATMPRGWHLRMLDNHTALSHPFREIDGVLVPRARISGAFVSDAHPGMTLWLTVRADETGAPSIVEVRAYTDEREWLALEGASTLSAIEGTSEEFEGLAEWLFETALPTRPITAAMLGRLPLERLGHVLLVEAVAALAESVRSYASGKGLESLVGPQWPPQEVLREALGVVTSTRGRRRTVPPDRLERVAALYREAQQTNPTRPTARVAEKLGVARKSAEVWVRQARKAGLLPPYSPPRKDER
jgi:hypothetical protein